MATNIDFSVIIPSRNRPSMLRKAVESVMAQSHEAFEVLIINDGSDDDCMPTYEGIAQDFAARVSLHNLPRTPSGHGPSFVINQGAHLAKGTFLAFLDDDDFWTDPHHLSRCKKIIDCHKPSPDVIYSNQCAIRNGKPVEEALWLNAIKDNQQVRLHCIDEQIPAFTTSVEELVSHPGFAHLNTSIIRRSLYQAIGGMDNGIRYEGDRDLYLRTIDTAEQIVYLPIFMAQHNVPDATRKDNESTATNQLQKLISQLHLLDKNRLLAHHIKVRKLAEQDKAIVLKKIAELLSKDQRYSEAALYAREALGIHFTLKWLGYTLLLNWRALSQ